jgi:4-diphosphocytidyl-2-C-methyl-D-erythritol kinase
VTGAAHAKVNLALVVGPVRSDGMHDVLTVFQRIGLADTVVVEPADATAVEGFPDDTLVTAALGSLGAPHGWRVVIDKQIPVAAGLGGGSSDAATALRLANDQLDRPLDDHALQRIAASVGADVPFFLSEGPQLGSGTGTTLEPLGVPQEFAVCLLLPSGAAKESTGSVYAAFDARSGGEGYDSRVSSLRAALDAVRSPRDLAALPPNDLARSEHADALRTEGAFRADVSGAGPVVYGLFDDGRSARRAAESLSRLGRFWVTDPAW